MGKTYRLCADASEPMTLYKVYADAGQGRFLAYVGISNCWQRRMLEHEAEKDWWHLVEAVEVEHWCCRDHAAQVEADEILANDPWFNKQGNPYAVGRR